MNFAGVRAHYRQGSLLLRAGPATDYLNEVNPLPHPARRVGMLCAALLPVGLIATLSWGRLARAPEAPAAAVVPALAGDRAPQLASRGGSAAATGRSAALFGRPINPSFAGMTCFRGNAQRNYYGEGPAPTGALKVLWRQTIGADPREPQWNGVGWTGQPLAVEWPEDARAHMNFTEPGGPETEIIVGGMDSTVHFYDAATGKPSRKALFVAPRNPIKGSVSVHPDGLPLLFVGNGLARPGAGYRVFSLVDFKQLAFISGRDGKAPRGWPAFDANGLVLDDTLLLPGENGLFYSIALNSKWDPETGKVSVKPRVVSAPVSSAGSECSLAVWNGYGYGGDSAGQLWRVDVRQPKKVAKLRRLGDDTDSTVTFDDDGTFYVGIQVDHRRGAGTKGTVFKFRTPDAQPVWRWDFPAQSFHGSSKIHDINGGILSTPAVWPEGNLVFVTTAHHPRMGQGSLVALDRETGKPRWTVKMRAYTWSSPTVVDGTVVAADSSGALYVRDAATGETRLSHKTGEPVEYLKLGATVEASPLVWRDRIYLGLRGGGIVCIGPAGQDAPADE